MHVTVNIAPLEIGLCVRDLDASLAFYQGALGFRFVSRIRTPEDSARGSGISSSSYEVVRLQLPTGERLKLFQPDRPAREPDAGLPLPLDNIGMAFITLIVSSLDAVLRHLEDAGHRPRQPDPFRLRQDVQVSLVDDPDGNVIELVQYDDPGIYRSELKAGGR